MAVNKGEAAAAVVVGGGYIPPKSCARVIEVISVVYGIGMLVNDQPGFRWFGDGGLLEVLFVLGIERVPTLRCGVIAATESPQQGIHGNAPQAELPAGRDLGKAQKRVG